MTTEDGYLIERIRDRLIHDDRIGELDLHVSIHGSVAVVTGNVSTKDRCAAIDEVMRQELPDHEIRNEVTIAVFPEPPS